MRILYTGGGTLGSVTPLLALSALDNASSRMWIGTASGPEREYIENQHIPFVGIRTFRLRRFLSLRTISEFPNLFTSYYKARKILKEFKPDIIITAGSYVGVPVCLAARRLHIPYAVMQLDVDPGLANTLLFSKAKYIFASNRFVAKKIGSPQKTTICGIPVPHLPKRITPQKPILVITGGGTGSRWLNHFVEKNINALSASCQVIHFRGNTNRSFRSISPQKKYFSFEHGTREQILDAFSKASLVVTRAGMGTLAELSALGKPTIIVPMPDSHQEHNAVYFAERNAALVIAQADGEESLLKEIISLLKDEKRKEQLSKAIVNAFPHDAISCIIEQIKKDL